MKLFHEGSDQDTFDMAVALLSSYDILEENEWYEHFSDVIGSFGEIIGVDYWATNFCDLEDVKSCKRAMNSMQGLNQSDFYVLKLVNIVIALMEPKEEMSGVE